MELKEEKDGHSHTFVDCDIQDLEASAYGNEMTNTPTCEQATEESDTKPQRMSLPVSIHITHQNGFAVRNKGKKDVRPDLIPLTKKDNIEIRHNLPCLPIPLTQTYAKMKSVNETPVSTVPVKPVMKDKGTYVRVIHSENKTVQTDPEIKNDTISFLLADEDRELLQFYKIYDIPPRKIISMIKKCINLTNITPNKQVSDTIEEKKLEMKTLVLKETPQEEKDQETTADKLLALSENNKKILLRYFEDENKNVNKVQVKETPLTQNTNYGTCTINNDETEQVKETLMMENNNSTINFSKIKEYSDNLRRLMDPGTLLNMFLFLKKYGSYNENGLSSTETKQKASTTTSIGTTPSSPVPILSQPPPKRRKVSPTRIEDYQSHKNQSGASQAANITLTNPFSDLQQSPNKPQVVHKCTADYQRPMNQSESSQTVQMTKVSPLNNLQHFPNLRGWMPRLRQVSPTKEKVSPKSNEDYQRLMNHSEQSQNSQVTTVSRLNNLQRYPTLQYGYDNKNYENYHATMPTPQASYSNALDMQSAHLIQERRIPILSPLQLHHGILQPSAKPQDSLYVRPQQGPCFQMNENNFELRKQTHHHHQGCCTQYTNQEQVLNQQDNLIRLRRSLQMQKSHSSQQQVQNQQSVAALKTAITTQEKKIMRIQQQSHMNQIQEYRQDLLEQPKLTSYFPNTQWSE